jgi:hypothetical protein
VLLAAFGVDFAGLGIEPLASPANFAPYVIGAWLLLGVIVLCYFTATDRKRITCDAAGVRRGDRHRGWWRPQPGLSGRIGRARKGAITG